MGVILESEIEEIPKDGFGVDSGSFFSLPKRSFWEKSTSCRRNAWFGEVADAVRGAARGQFGPPGEHLGVILESLQASRCVQGSILDVRGVILEVILRSESEEIPKSVSGSIFCRFGVLQKDHFGKRAPRRDETLVFGSRYSAFGSHFGASGGQFWTSGGSFGKSF